jgi:membrane-associated phospholipid phosphatase
VRGAAAHAESGRAVSTRRRRATIGVSVLIGVLSFLGASAGRAQDEQSPARVEWSSRWASFRWWEYGATPVLGAASIYLHYYAPLPAQSKWQGDNAVDGTIRGWLRADTREGRDQAGTIGDALWLGGTAVPFVVDLPVVLLAHRQPYVAWQLLMMDLEANAVVGFINNALFYEVGRGRPSYARCATDASYDALCGSTGNNASFPSGHVLGIATAAGLTCVHHRYLPIYGSATAGAAACVIMTAATAATGVTRIVADRHYASDVVVGAAIGFAGGYGLPWLLHYRTAGEGAGPEARRVVLVPFGGAGSVGIGVAGLLW